MKYIRQIWKKIFLVLELPIRYIWGRDAFISYSRRDADAYAPSLVAALREEMPNLSVYLDKYIAPPDGNLPSSLLRHLRWSSMLVLICSEKSIVSPSVIDEITHFTKFGRKVVLIDVDNALSKVNFNEMPWEKIRGADPEDESGEAFKEANPSENVVKRITESAKFTLQDARLKRSVWGTLTLVIAFLAIAAAASYFIVNKAYAEVADANVKTVAAELARTQAVEDANRITVEAGERVRKANEDVAAAEAKVLEADKKVVSATKLAEDQTKLAKEQSRLAEEKTRLADAAAKEAEAQTEKARVAEQNRLAAEKLEEKGRSVISQNYYSIAQTSARAEAANGFPWIQKAIETAPQNDGNLNIYKSWAVNLTEDIPKLIIRPPGGIGQKPIYNSHGDRAATVSASGQISLWNLQTGEEISRLLENCNCGIHLIYPEENKINQQGTPSGGNPVFSSDGKLIAALTEESDGIRLRVWKAGDGSEMLNKIDPLFSSNFLSGDFQNFRFTPDSRAVMLDVRRETEDERILVLDAETGEGKNFITSEPVIYSEENLKSGFGVAKLPISSNPRRNWALTFQNEGKIEQIAVVRDLSTGQVVGQTPLPEHLEYVNFTGGGGRLVMVQRTANNGRLISAFDIESNIIIEPVRFATSIGQEYKILGFSKDDNRLLVDCGNINLDMWDLNQKGARTYADGMFYRKNLKAFFTADEKQTVYISETFSSTFSNPQYDIHIINLQDGRRFNFANLNGEVSVSSSANLILREVGNSILVKDVKEKTGNASTFEADAEKFPLETNECFIKAARVPRQKTLLTVSLNPCSLRRGEPSTVTMQLWNLETKKPLWNQNGVLLGKSDNINELNFDINFSKSGKSFITIVPTDSFASNESQRSGFPSKTLRIWETATGNQPENFQPLVSDIEAASFNGDESQLLTLTLDGRNVRHIYRTNIIDNQTTYETSLGVKTGYNSPFLTTDGRYVVMVRSDVEFAVRSLENNSGADRRYFFTNRDAAFLATNLIKKADTVTVNDGGILADFKDDFTLSITSSGDLSVTPNDGDIIPILPPAELARAYDDISISRNGKLILYSDTYSINLFESQTRVPVKRLNTNFAGASPNIFAYAEILPDSENLLIIEKDGKIYLQKIFSQTEKIPVWLTNMGEALSGMKIKNGISAEPILHNEYLKVRRRYYEKLVEAANQKDSEAAFILQNWNP